MAKRSQDSLSAFPFLIQCCSTLYRQGVWLKCVSLTDRGSHDIAHHSRCTGVKLAAEVPLETPTTIDWLEVQPNRIALRKAYKKHAKSLGDQLAGLDQTAAAALRAKLCGNKSVQLDGCALSGDMVTVAIVQKVQHVAEIVPVVLHASFGVGRLLQVVLDTPGTVK